MEKIYSFMLIFFLSLTFPEHVPQVHAAGSETLRPDNLWAEFEERRRAVGAKMEAATVWIVTEGWCHDCAQYETTSGTGFIVGDGYIATNAHVIDGLERSIFYILNEKIPVRQATLINSIHKNLGEASSGRDLALLRFDPPKGVELPVLSFSFEVRRMDRVSSWGYPGMVTEFDISAEHLRRGDMGGLVPAPVMFTEGTVNTFVRDRFGTSSILHSAAIAGGNSGGPLVNSRGEVVGMNTWGYTEKDEGAFLNGAQLSSEIVAFLADSGITPRLAPGQQLTAAVRPQPETPTMSPGLVGRLQPGAREDRRRDAGGFSVVVPRGWSVLDEEHNMILVGADDDTAAVGIFLLEIEGRSLRQVARDLSGELDGTRPGLDDDVYIFTFSEDGIDSIAFVGDGDYEGQYVFIFITGDFENPGVEEVLDSVE